MSKRQLESVPLAARRITLHGRVQGVGFRPFVYRIAQSHGLAGWVRNDSGMVLLHVEGRAADIDAFERALVTEAPPLARPHITASEDAAPVGAGDFRILASQAQEAADIHVPPDLFCCDDCVAELLDPAARRFRYPFTNCTQCGPRYTLIRALPYDRPNTAMAGFALCPDCRAEYYDPGDRRFHAQPLACPLCGPKLSLRGESEDALERALACLRQGGIVAVKGVGGYHLLCDPTNDAAVLRLRARKHRPHKPLAVMFPQSGADGLEALRRFVTLEPAEERALTDAARPILLVRRHADSPLSLALAPGLAELGVFLPYSPLHHLLLADFGGPLVATSGNISGEPVLTDDRQAERGLGNVADLFLHHDRPILRPADDSVLRVIGGKPRPIRLGRGMAPVEIDLAGRFAEPTLAVGGHMKATIALGWGSRAVVSPHIGELDSPRSLQVFAQVIADLQALYGVTAQRIVCDAHPDYASTRWAQAQPLPVRSVQHHAAHASALAGEHPEIERWLVFAWDGIGLGGDGDLWGGEALLGAPAAWRRVGSLRPFHLTGGDRAGREPWRSAAALMWESGEEWQAPVKDAALVEQAWRKRVGTLRSSSAGRLFDAAASLVLGLDVASFEGQGPMTLEAIAAPAQPAIGLPLLEGGDGIWRIDWQPLLPMLADEGLAPEIRAGIFHESLARALVAQALLLARIHPVQAVGLTGGVFQNRLLAERVTTLLQMADLPCHLPETLPANDGGLAFGQLIESLHGGGG